MSEAPLRGQSIESPLEIKVYVPSTTKDKSISDKEFEQRVNNTESSLSKMFGGFTSSNVEGGYTALDGGVISEKVAIVTSWVDEKTYRERLPNLERFLKDKQKEWEQEVIGFEFENDFFMFPKSFNTETFHADSKEEARLKKYEKTYGKEGAKVRNRIFKRILANAQDGTKAGQWSARKAQSLTEDYEKAMKGKGKKAYKSSKRTKTQKSLKKWGDQKWRTKSGQDSSKTGERYLPEKAIKALTDKEYKKTSAKKRKDMKQGKQFSEQPKNIAKKVAQYRAEPYSVDVSRSTNPEKKLMAVFEDKEGKKVKTTHFGQRGASDYTKHGDKERMERYLERHGGGTTTSTKENWKDPTTAGSLSRWVLWNKPSFKGSFADYKRRFGLKGNLKVSRSADTFESRTNDMLITYVERIHPDDDYMQEQLMDDITSGRKKVSYEEMMAEESADDWYGLKNTDRWSMDDWEGWTYEDNDGIVIYIDGPNGSIYKGRGKDITLDEAKAYLNRKGIPYGRVYRSGEWDSVQFTHPKEECYKHDWSKDYHIEDARYEGDDGTGGVVFGQRCNYVLCDAVRQGHVGGKVHWDMAAEEMMAEDFHAPYQPNQTMSNYDTQSLAYSNTVTGDFTTDSLKFGYGVRRADWGLDVNWGEQNMEDEEETYGKIEWNDSRYSPEMLKAKRMKNRYVPPNMNIEKVDGRKYLFLDFDNTVRHTVPDPQPDEPLRRRPPSQGV